METQNGLALLREIADRPSNRGYARFLILGEKGAGKTSLLKTCPKPILVDSFDPGGTEVLNPEIKEGSVIADCRFETDDIFNPTAFALFEKERRRRAEKGIFDAVGTYVIDSLTSCQRALVWAVAKKEQRTPAPMDVKSGENNYLRIQDWGLINNYMIQLCSYLAKLPCHTILLGHLCRDKDANGNIAWIPVLSGQASNNVPYYTPESLVMRKSVIAGKVVRTLLTQDDGLYKASTRMCGLDPEEPPNIRALLKKAEYRTEDKPWKEEKSA